MGSDWPRLSVDELKASTDSAIAIGPFGSRMKADLYTASGVRVIRGNNISDTHQLCGEFVHVSEGTASELRSSNLAPEDLVFPHRGSIGEVGIVPADGRRYLLSTSLMKLTCNRELVDPRFLFYFFRSPTGRHELLKNASTVGTPGIATPLSSLRSIRVPVPPLGEQRAISHVLGTLDDKIELNRRTNETLDAITRALFQSWFVDFDPVHANSDGRAPTGRAGKDAAIFPRNFVDSPLGPIPEGWNALPVYNLAHYVNGAAYKAFQPNDQRRGLPIIKIAELKSGVTMQTKFSDVEMPEKYRLRNGDILFSWSGNPDTSIDTFVWGHGPAWLNQHIFRVEPPSEMERSYVLATLKWLRPIFAEIARNKQTTGLGHVTAGDMQRLLVVKPDSRVLSAWHDVTTPLFDAVFSNEQESLALARLRDELLPRLLAGEVDTSALAVAGGVC